MITALVLSFLIGPAIIRVLQTYQVNGQPIRADGPEGHLVTKKGTPTMGGLMILLALSVATLLWADLTNPYVWAALAVTIAYGAIGFVDDYLKVIRQHSAGLSGRLKLVLQTAVAVAVSYWLASILPAPLATKLAGAVPQERPYRSGMVLLGCWRRSSWSVPPTRST